MPRTLRPKHPRLQRKSRLSQVSIKSATLEWRMDLRHYASDFSSMEHAQNLLLALATTGSHRVPAQSALAGGARARSRTVRVHGIISTSGIALSNRRSRNRGPCSLCPFTYRVIHCRLNGELTIKEGFNRDIDRARAPLH